MIKLADNCTLVHILFDSFCKIVLSSFSYNAFIIQTC